MKLTISIGGYGRAEIKQAVEFVQAAERLGVDGIWSAEAWGQDAISSLPSLSSWAHEEYSFRHWNYAD